MFDPKDYEINEQNYRFTYNTIKFLLRISPLKVNMHDLGGKAESGSIFLLNHFTRFETFIPQYILYGKAKVFCRAVADHQLFDDSLVGDYLRSVGAMPSNLANMMDYMVSEVNAGRKLVIFPEGSMIKDRRVRDAEGRLAIYKREGGIRRKPHTGAAVMGIKCQILRDLYMMAREKGDDLMVDYYRRNFSSFDKPEEIDDIASRPVELVPANITFYPMRRDENILEKYVKKISGVTSKRVLEELKVESNILLKETDMDVRFGDTINVKNFFGGSYGAILKSRYLCDRIDAERGGWFKKAVVRAGRKRVDGITAGWIKGRSETMRDVYMNDIYDLTTINLAHLTAHTLYDLNRKNPNGRFDMFYLRSLLYLAISDLRNTGGLHLHRDIAVREYINDLLIEEEPHLIKILRRFEKAGLLEMEGERFFTIKEKLEKDFPFDSVRLENPALVLDNEAQSVPKAIEALDRLYKEGNSLLQEKVSLLLYRRALKIFEHERDKFQGAEYDRVNKGDQRTASGEPFFYRTGKKAEEKRGALLIHGFSASPAEMKLLGDYLYEKGYDVFGMRLPGHGTSPADLREREREEWVKEVKLGLSLLKHCCAKTFVIGNSMGALVGLMAMGTSSFEIAGYVAIAPSFKIKDRRISLVTYVDAAQRLYELFAELKTEWPYQESRPENPHINYSVLPYHGLFELYQVTREAQEFIGKLHVPTLFIQAEKEYTVDPEATYEAFKKVPAEKKSLVKIDETKHVLTLDKNLPVFKEILDFLERTK